MSEDSLEAASEPEEAPGTNAAAVALALDGARHDPALSGAIAAFLRDQQDLMAAQRHHLREQLKRLKVGILDQRLTMALKILTVIIGIAVAGGFAIMVWKASEARGLVVDAFSAPPDFAQRGIGGDVVAQDVMGKLAAVRATAMAHSYSISNDVSKDGGDIKVEIPETGVSITEAWRLLRGWLGHERHVTGSLREAADGRVVLGAAIDGEEVAALSGATTDLTALEKQMAEQIFGRFDPVNYTNYLGATGRLPAAYESAAVYVSTARSLLQKSDAYSLWSYTTAFVTGDLDLATDRSQMAIEIDPNLAVAHVQLMRFESIKGHDEAVLAQARTVLRLKNADQPPAHQGPGFASMRAQSSGLIGALTGDFAEASEMECAHACPLALQRISQSLFAARLHDITGARLLMRQARAAGAKSNSASFEARYWIDAQAGDWAAAEADIKAATAADVDENSSKNPRFTAEEQATSYTPLRSLIQARLGAFATAHATIDQTPADCYLCIETRGNLAVAERNWGAAVFWFAKAVQQGPSIPFAYSEWGRMLLAKGDFAGAVAKFAAAHQKGPHFADPLELWGEALMAQNRSDLALAKFAEAAQYAPNWGRLHLKWGEALHWLGRDGDARVQWAAAAKLDLTEVERHTLARLSGSGA